MRYFFWSATWHSGHLGKTTTQNNTLKTEKFPSLDELNQFVREDDPRARSIVLLSICEMSKADFEALKSKT